MNKSEQDRYAKLYEDASALRAELAQAKADLEWATVKGRTVEGLTATIAEIAAERDAFRADRDRICVERDEARDYNSTLEGERDAAIARAEALDKSLHEHVGKQALKEMLRQMMATAAERDALACAYAALREALEVVQAMFLHPVGADADYGSLKLADTRAREYTSTALSLTPPDALDAVKREAAAAELERFIEVELSTHTAGASPYAVARNTKAAEVIIAMRQRIAELRGKHEAH